MSASRAIRQGRNRFERRDIEGLTPRAVLAHRKKRSSNMRLASMQDQADGQAREQARRTAGSRSLAGVGRDAVEAARMRRQRQ
ncbi:hypothetical protein [Sorangium cellulosum]|uniref:hypothetical protein n=1 Tax=Sorangium cellulosum TaxID=56 RepID=UPI001012C994|nr:hypothetical protein [Sorangium cellulosum]